MMFIDIMPDSFDWPQLADSQKFLEVLALFLIFSQFS